MLLFYLYVSNFVSFTLFFQKDAFCNALALACGLFGTVLMLHNNGFCFVYQLLVKIEVLQNWFSWFKKCI